MAIEKMIEQAEATLERVNNENADPTPFLDYIETTIGERFDSIEQAIRYLKDCQDLQDQPEEPETSIPKAEVKPSITSITAKQLVEKEFDPLNWVVDELIPEGLIVLAGAPKIGKSFLCWNLALAVSQGGKALSVYDVSEPKTVIYFALEDPGRQIKNRLKMIQPEGNFPENLHIYTRFPIILGEAGLEEWQNTIKDHEADFVIVDTMHHVIPRNDSGTAYQQDYALLAPIQKMVHDMGISMMLVTHTRKMLDVDNPFNQIQGSVGVQAACDTMIMLTQSDGVKTIHINGREVLPQDFVVEISEGTFVAKSDEEVQEDAMPKGRIEILKLLKDAGDDGLTCKEIVEGVSMSETNAKATLKRMKQDEQVFQPKPRGRYFAERPSEFEMSTEVDDVPL